MKKPSVPKHHSQLGLPIGTRLRFVKASPSRLPDAPKPGWTDADLGVGHIAPGSPLPSGQYWIRPLHSSHPVQVCAERIKFLEYIPGAPRPCPRCPAPQPRKLDQPPAIIFDHQSMMPAPLPPPPPLPAQPGALLPLGISSAARGSSSKGRKGLSSWRSC